MLKSSRQFFNTCQRLRSREEKQRSLLIRPVEGLMHRNVRLKPVVALLIVVIAPILAAPAVAGSGAPS